MILIFSIIPLQTEKNNVQTFKKNKEMKIIYMVLFFMSIVQSHAQTNITFANMLQMNLYSNWDNPKEKYKNKDQNISFDVYFSNQRLVIVQDTPVLDCYYIVNKRGVVVLNGDITPTDDINSFTISLKDLRNDEYTLYLYEGTKFWYGTFTIKQ